MAADLTWKPKKKKKLKHPNTKFLSIFHMVGTTKRAASIFGLASYPQRLNLDLVYWIKRVTYIFLEYDDVEVVEHLESSQDLLHGLRVRLLLHGTDAKWYSGDLVYLILVCDSVRITPRTGPRKGSTWGQTTSNRVSNRTRDVGARACRCHQRPSS